jgi:hypothetical protein
MIDKIYREKIKYPYEKEILIKKIHQNVSLFYHEPSHISPGIQTNIVLSCKEIDFILNYGVKKCIELFKKDKKVEEVDYCLYPWLFISRNENTQSHYHNHTMFAPHIKKSIESNCTFTYYVQMPNNLTGNDGKLFFMDKEDNVQRMFLPEENELVIFPADVHHRPETSINSTIDRIVIAGNVLFDFPILKEKKTIL